MATISDRITTLSNQLMIIASTQTADAGRAHELTHIALMRILRKDPDLDHFAQIQTTLESEIEARESRLH
jgi:hypothetical protein